MTPNLRLLGQEEIDPKWPPFRITFATRALYERLITLREGETATYQDLAGVLGSDAPADWKTNALASARRIAERDDQVVVQAVPNIGIRRLTNSEASKSGHTFRCRAGSAMRRAQKRLRYAVVYENLSPAEKIEHNAQLAVYGAVRLLAKPKAVQKAITAINTAGIDDLTIRETLNLFKK